MSIDSRLHGIYDAELFYHPTPTAVYCNNCGTRLKAYYAEGGLYVVKCGYCDTITIVKASNPTQAARYVGDYERKGGADDDQRKAD